MIKILIIYIYIYISSIGIYIYTVNCSEKVDTLSLKKISTKLGFDLKAVLKSQPLPQCGQPVEKYT